MRSSGRDGSIATRLFLASWSRLVSGWTVDDAMRADVASALAACRLGDLDRPTLLEAGLATDEIAAVLHRGFDEVAAPLDRGLADALRSGLDASPPVGVPPLFARRLSRQPRAGVTCPGQARLVLEPPENHAEHCAVVAVASVLMAPVFEAEPGRVWLASLAHHLHNALLPDSGFAGEMLLGDALPRLMDGATEHALAELPSGLAAAVRDGRRILDDAATPEGRAFHAADTLDRVWQIEQHLRPGQVTLATVLGDMALVHAGPVKDFQDAVLEAAGIAA